MTTYIYSVIIEITSISIEVIFNSKEKTMNKREKAKLIFNIVFYSIWLIFALVLWIHGLTKFRETSDFGTWVAWGAICIFPIIIPILKLVFSSAKDGMRNGANEYTASVSGNNIYIRNHPIRGAVIGLLAGVFGGLLVGPVMLAIYILKNIFELLSSVLDLVKICREA